MGQLGVPAASAAMDSVCRSLEAEGFLASRLGPEQQVATKRRPVLQVSTE
jgi:hypothetical protein